MTCLQTNIFGTWEHTLFLGLSIRSFSMNLGLNGEPNSCTVELVNDPCSGTKRYYDALLRPQIWTGPDPASTYFPPHMGAPVYFRVGSFEFAGILTRAETNGSIDGNPIYLVTIVGPRELLDGVQLITKGYAGAVGTNYNVLNCYGLLEHINPGSTCCAGYDPFWSTVNGFPTPAFIASSFGGADVSEDGMTWKSIKRAIHLLTARFNPTLSNIVDPYNNFCYGGRLVFPGDPRVGFGYLPRDVRFDAYGVAYASYLLDLSEIPDGAFFAVGETSFNIRLGDGGTMSLGDALDEVSARIGFDYYVDLMPSFSSLGELVNVIRVRGISKYEAYDSNAIQAFVNSQPGKITYNHGKEFRNEPTSALIIGGQRRDVIEATGTAVLPYWGTDINGDIIFGSTTDLDDNHAVTIDITDLGLVDTLANPITSYTFTVGELRAALVNLDLWQSYLASKGATIATQLGMNATWGQLPQFAVDEFVANANPALTLKNFQRAKLLQANVNSITELYNFVRKYAEEYYGRKFIIPVPQTCIRYSTGDIAYETSHEPSPDGGWPIVFNPLSLSSVGLFYFRGDNGLVQPLVYFGSVKSAAVDYSNLDPNDYVTDGLNIYLPCGLESDFVYLDYDNKCSPYMVFTLNNSVNEKLGNNDDIIFDGMVAVLLQQNGINGVLNEAQVRERLGYIFQNSTDRFLNSIPFGQERFKPDGVLGALKSNILTYGPWSSQDIPTCISVSPISIVPGQTIVERDEELVPWNFNGENVLNCFGILKARDLVAKAQAVEMGTIRVAGLPVLPLGHEIMASAPQLAQFRNMSSFTDGSINFMLLELLDQNGNNQFGIGLTTWTGLYGPNISSINVSYSDSEVTTEYIFRTYTRQIRGNVAKANIERFRKQASTRLAISKNITDFVNNRLNQRTANKLAIERGLDGDPQGGLFNVPDIMSDNRSKIGRTIAAKNADAHNVLVGGSDRFFGAPSGLAASGGSAYLLDRDIWCMQSSAFTNPQTAMIDLDIPLTGYRAFAETNTLFRPVLFPGTSGSFTKLPHVTPLSQYEPPNTSATSGGSFGSTRPPAFPSINTSGTLTAFSGSANTTINSTTLNPFFHPGFALDPSGFAFMGGHDMDYVLRYGSGGLLTEFSNNFVTARSGYYDAYRYGAFALRGPLVLTGWGYDTQGYPVPNAVSGDNPSTKSEYFLQNFGRKPHMWKTGPVDLRWDYARGVWTANSSSYPPVLGKLNQHIGAEVETAANLYASGNTATLINYDGSPISGNNIVPITNVLGHPIGSGSRVWLDFDPNNSTYVISNAEYKPVCVVTRVDCYPDEDNVSRLDVCFRTLYVNAGFSTERCATDDPFSSGDFGGSGEVSGNCGGGFFDYGSGAGTNPTPSLPNPTVYYNGIGYNVKSFGAFGNGSDDDTEALQEAYDFVGGLTNGGTVYYPDGTYLTTRQSALGAFNYNVLITGNNVRSYGAGKNAVITNGGGSTGAIFRTSTTSNQTNISFENLTIDGNWNSITWGWDNYSESGGVIISSGSQVANIIDQHGIALYGVKNSRISNVHLKNIGMNAIHIASCLDAEVVDCTIEHAGKNGIYCLASAGINIDNNVVNFCNNSPDSGSTKDYFLDVSGSWACIYVDVGPSGSIVDTAFSSVKITNNRLKTYTSNGIVVRNNPNTIIGTNNVIESKNLLSSAMGTRPLIRLYYTGNAAQEPVNFSDNILHNLDSRGIGLSVDIYDLDDLDFTNNRIYGLQPSRFLSCNQSQIDNNTWYGTSGVFAVYFGGMSGDYMFNSSLSHNIVSSHVGNIGLYCTYIKDSLIESNISRNMGNSSGIWLDHVYASEINHNIHLSGVGFAIDPDNSVSGCIISHNYGASHYVTSGQLEYNFADHNVPLSFNSTSNLGLGMIDSGVPFGNSLGGLSQSTPNFYWNSSNKSLFAYNIRHSGEFITGGDSEFLSIGKGVIFLSPSGGRFKATISDLGVLQVVQL